MSAPSGHCDHCDLPLSQCEHGATPSARSDLSGRPYEADLVADGPTITATQKSPCAGCGDLIEPGDTITHTEDGWAHADEVLPKPAPSPNAVDFSGF